MKVGDRVVWLRTLGGGGGSGKRANAKEPVESVVTKVGPRRVQIERAGRVEGKTWVDRANVRPVLSDKGKALLRAFGDAQFACGEWDRNDSDEDWTDVYAEAERAERELADYLAALGG